MSIERRSRCVRQRRNHLSSTCDILSWNNMSSTCETENHSSNRSTRSISRTRATRLWTNGDHDYDLFLEEMALCVQQRVCLSVLEDRCKLDCFSRLHRALLRRATTNYGGERRRRHALPLVHAQRERVIVSFLPLFFVFPSPSCIDNELILLQLEGRARRNILTRNWRKQNSIIFSVRVGKSCPSLVYTFFLA